MPNPGWWETAYDRLRGKEELGKLKPFPIPIPTDKPNPTNKNSINALGARIKGEYAR